MINKIQNGDCLEVLKNYPDNYFTSIITDPPYGLSFMGKKWDYDVPSIEIWEECLRVLKPGGTALIFAGSRTQHRMAVNMEDAGFFIKDCLMWLYGSGFPKSTDISKQLDKISTLSTPEAKQWNGYKSHGLKPAYEPIIMAMKPNEGSYASNALKWGVSGLNIEAGRIDFQSERDKKKACREMLNYKNHNENRNVFACMNGKGNEKRGNPQGRFPANIILDEEAAKILDEQTGISKEDGASRFFYCAKASNTERGEGNNHPTVKPLKLIEYLIKLIMPPEDGLILDPFAGSGTTILAAKKLDYSAIGIEREEEYTEIALKRIKNIEKDLWDLKDGT